MFPSCAKLTLCSAAFFTLDGEHVGLSSIPNHIRSLTFSICHTPNPSRPTSPKLEDKLAFLPRFSRSDIRCHRVHYFLSGPLHQSQSESNNLHPGFFISLPMPARAAIFRASSKVRSGLSRGTQPADDLDDPRVLPGGSCTFGLSVNVLKQFGTTEALDPVDALEIVFHESSL